MRVALWLAICAAAISSTARGFSLPRVLAPWRTGCAALSAAKGAVESAEEPAASKANDKEWMFFDVAKVNVKAGAGGDGCMAMRREYCVEFGGPSGGNGGNGGSIFFECDARLNTLSHLRRQMHVRAADGANGLGDSRHGPQGADTIVPVPPGTLIRDATGALAGELFLPGDRLLVARGGRGGRGNHHFRSPRHPAPVFSERGEHGDDRWLHLELKLVADVGLVGLPNAGKSTLLAAISRARPKIAAYPFTTVVPHLGVCDLSATINGLPSFVVADIPGLLEGAHAGRGLGDAFLRHVQRCRVLLHLVAADRGGGVDEVVRDYAAVQRELRLYDPRLASKPQVVVLSKLDAFPAQRGEREREGEREEGVEEVLRRLREACGHSRVVALSAATGENVQAVMTRVGKLVQALPPVSLFTQTQTEQTQTLGAEEETGREGGETASARCVDLSAGEDAAWEVTADGPHAFRLHGDRLQRLVERTDWRYYEGKLRFHRILEAWGVPEALRRAGAVQGDTVRIGDLAFDYWEKGNRWIADLDLDD